MTLTMTFTSKKHLIPAQLRAINRWALLEGRRWKQALSYAWADGNYHGFSDYGILQGIRNQFGPTWLMDEFNLKEELAVHAEEAQMGYQILCSVVEYLRWMIDIEEPLERLNQLKLDMISDSAGLTDVAAAHEYAHKWQAIHFAHDWNAYKKEQ